MTQLSQIQTAVDFLRPKENANRIGEIPQWVQDHQCVCLKCGWRGAAGHTSGDWAELSCPKYKCQTEVYSFENLTEGQKLLLMP